MDNIYMDFKNNKNDEYMKQKQKFFDLVDNIEDEKLRKNIVYQMLKLEKLLQK